MADYTIFKVNSTDYTPQLIRQDYHLTRADVVETWTDANYKTHLEVVRTRVTGSLKLLFQNTTEYDGFLTNLVAVRASNGTYTLQLHVDNSASTTALETIYAAVTVDVGTTYGTPMYGYYPTAFVATVTIEEV